MTGKKSGGGAAVYIDPMIWRAASKEVQKNTSQSEGVGIITTHRATKKQWGLVSYYIRPGLSRSHAEKIMKAGLETILDELIDTGVDYIAIGGDFNKQHLKYSKAGFTVTQIVKVPTRKDNILDIIYVTTSPKCFDVFTSEGVADHLTVHAVPKCEILGERGSV